MHLEKIGFTDTEGRFLGKYINPELTAFNPKVKFCNVVFGWDINDMCFDEENVTGWKSGFADGTLTVYDDTDIKLPWEDSAIMRLADFNDDEKLRNVCPRSLLKDLQQKYLEIGLLPSIGFEFEWFNFKKTDPNEFHLNKQPLTQGMNGYSLLELSNNHSFIKSLLEQLLSIGVPIVNFHKETGPGVLELAIKNDYMVNAADFATLFKYGTKAISYKHNIIASFMARWNQQYPGSGNHIHISMLNKQFDEVFNFKENNLNDLSSHFLAGLLQGLPHLMPLMAPNINSYKRYEKNSWTPLDFSWSYDSRTSAIRIKRNVEGIQHLEIRVPGSDANPYLATYAILSAGLYGINNKLTLNSKPQNNSEAHSQELEKVPASLKDAVRKMENSPIINDLINPKFADFFIISRKHEIKQFEKHITNWELDRYMFNA